MNAVSSNLSPAITLSADTLRHWPLPATDDIADKEDRGHVVVVAGSREIPGAAVLAATAALRAGAGKLTIATAQSIAAGLALALPEARVIALPETPAGGLHFSGASLLDTCAAHASAVLIGPGLLDAESSCELIEALLEKLHKVPVILDALAMDVVLRKERFEQPVLLTPHAGEMAHLTLKPKDEVLSDALKAAQDNARGWNAVVALKGATTFIATPDGNCWCHTAGMAGLATSGSGDTLAGLMVGLAARGASLEQAAAWGVVLHALAGKRLTERVGPLGFLARELLAEIPAVMRDI